MSTGTDSPGLLALARLGGLERPCPDPSEAWAPDATRGHFGGLYLSLALRMLGLKDSSKDLSSLKLWARYLARCGPRLLLSTPGASGGPSWAGTRGARLLPSLGVGTAEPCAGQRLGATGLCPFWVLEGAWISLSRELGAAGLCSSQLCPFLRLGSARLRPSWMREGAWICPFWMLDGAWISLSQGLGAAWLRPSWILEGARLCPFLRLGDTQVCPFWVLGATWLCPFWMLEGAWISLSWGLGTA